MQNVTTLKFWMMPNAGYDTSLNMGKEIADFEKLYPGVKVELSLIPWSQAWKKIMTAAKTKQLPDVFEIGNTWTKTMAAINALSDITAEANGEHLKDKFYSSAWDTCEIQELDKVYSLPWAADVRLIFYRKDIFSKTGLTARNLDTWQSFEEACAALSGYRDNVGPVNALGVGDLKDSGLVHEVAPWVWSAGGDFLTADGMMAGFQEREAFRGIKFYFDLMHKGYAPITGRKVPGYPVNDFFAANRYSMIIISSVAAYNMPGFFEKASRPGGTLPRPEVLDKFGVAFLPAGPGGRFSFLGGYNLAISDYSEHREEAWQFIKYLTSKEFQIRQYKAASVLPTGIDALNALFHEGTDNEKVLIETYKNYGRSYKQVDAWGSIEFILVEFFGNIIDAIKSRGYSGDFLIRETNKYAEQVNYILSL